jgi:hypothetical protein
MPQKTFNEEICSIELPEFALPVLSSTGPNPISLQPRPDASSPQSRWQELHNTEPHRTRTGESSVQSEATSERIMAVAAHPLAELLECPPMAGDLLNESSKCIGFDAGEIVFRQFGPSRGLYVVVSGNFQRKAERLNSRVILGHSRAGDLVELAAALGDGNHTYTLSAVTPGTMLLLPIEALRRAFEGYPPLRMRLLEELAREVSRAYYTCMIDRVTPRRRNRLATV